MEISYLEEFLAITKNMNLSDVADQLFVSQSTLSRHIQKLENELNIQLFDRTKQKLTLTSNGEMILPYVEKIIKEHTKLIDAISYNCHCSNPKLAIGFTSFAMNHDLSALIFDFAKDHPEISWQFIEENHNKLYELLNNSQCDFAFIRHPYDNESEIENHINWHRDHFVAVLPAHHALARETSVTLKQLQDETFIMIRDHFLINGILHQVCGQWGFHPKILAKNKSLDSVLTMVMYGDGVSIITNSEANCLKPNYDVSFIEIEPRLNLATTLFCSFDSPPTKAHEEFIRHLKSKGQE